VTIRSSISDAPVTIRRDNNIPALATTVEGGAGVTFPILDALPRTAFGELLVAQFSPTAAWRFDYGVNTRIVTSTTANGGTVTASESRARLSTSSAVNGSARIQSNNRLRYLPGVGGLVRFTAAYAAGAANSRQLIGIGDSQDGFFFGYSGATFGVIRRRAGVDDFIPQSSWNGSQVNFSPQLGNIYAIRFQWLGYGFIRFYIVDPNSPTSADSALNFGARNVHTILYPNTSALTHILNPTLPLFAEVANTGNASDLVLFTPSGVAGLEGQIETPYNPLDEWNSVDTALALANTSNNHVLSVQNKTTLAAITNRVPVQLASLTVARGTAGASLSTIRLYRNATTAIGRVYTDVDASNSPVSTSVTTTTVTGGTVERAYTVTAAGTTFTIEFAPGEFVLQPGEILTIGIQNNAATSTDFVVTANWKELF